MTDLTDLTLFQARDGLLMKDFTALELTESYLAAIKKYNNVFNAYIKICEEEALKQARSCLLYTSPSPRDKRQSRMPSSA